MAEEDAKIEAGKCRCDARVKDDDEKKRIQQEI